MDLNLAFHSLEDSMARAFFGTVLGTHRLSGLDGAVGAAAVLRDVSWLVAALRARLTDNSTTSSASSVSLSDLRRTKANLGSSSDNLAGCDESFSDTDLAHRRVDGLLPDDGGLVAGSHVLLANGADAAAWIRAKVFYLTNVSTTSMSSSFHIVQNNALNVSTSIIGSAAFVSRDLHK